MDGEPVPGEVRSFVEFCDRELVANRPTSLQMGHPGIGVVLQDGTTCQLCAPREPAKPEFTGQKI